MTSNLGGSNDFSRLGFGGSEEERLKSQLREVAKHFRPELINRINEQIIFKSLNQNDVQKILAPMLEEIQQNLEKQYQVKLEIDESAKAFIAQEGYDPKYGARELRRVVERLVQIPLSELILAGKLEKDSTWKMIQQGQLTIDN
jgi:ATP-dependent Clp protease ATP-binding subunit ClpA